MEVRFSPLRIPNPLSLNVPRFWHVGCVPFQDRGSAGLFASTTGLKKSKAVY
jgi:hypothetical protein